MNELNSFLSARGYAAAIGLPLDGAYHRFFVAPGDSERLGWFKGRSLANGHIVASIGNWRTKEKLRFTGELTALTPEQRLQLDTEWAEEEATESAERTQRQEEAATACQDLWANAIDQGSTPYLDKKGLPGLFGARIHPDATSTLLVPICDIDGKLWSLQKIFGEKSPNGTDKMLWPGGRKEGCFHLMGVIDPKGVVYVTEGFATAASIFQALRGEGAVAAAMDAGNLAGAGRNLRDRYPDLRIIFCADNDKKHEPGSNPGVSAAREAAHGVGGEVRIPISRRSEPTRSIDFDDLRQIESLEEVKQQLLNPPAPAPTAPAQAEKKKKFSEKLVSDWMLSAYEGKLVRQDKSLFHYDGSKWDELDSVGLDVLKNHINSLCGDTLGSKEVASCYNTFFRYVPAVPEGVNLFEPSRDKANFKNGTLHLKFWAKTPEQLAGSPGTGTHYFESTFAPHNPTDFCTTVLPLDYQPETTLPENEPFQLMLRNVWPDADQGGKIALYEELLGACLLPIFPMVFFFVGIPRSGKSTLLMLLAKLVGSENTAHVDPTTWHGSFGMENLVNKLVNIDTDISTSRRLPDDLMKKVIDQTAQIARKYKASVDVRLPGIHAFGANDMPRNLEGGSGAYDRRAVIVRTTTPQAGFGGGGGFSDWVWAQGSGGILKAALRGLNRLLTNGGRYTVPESSVQEMKDWGVDNDHLQQFVTAIEHQEIFLGSDPIVIHPEARIESQLLYTRFVQYVSERDPASYKVCRIISDISFAKRLRHDRRFVSVRTNTKRYVSGIGVRGQEGTSF